MVFPAGNGVYTGQSVPVAPSTYTPRTFRPVVPAGDGSYQQGQPTPAGSTGPRITVSATEPLNPNINDVWIDTS